MLCRSHVTVRQEFEEQVELLPRFKDYVRVRRNQIECRRTTYFTRNNPLTQLCLVRHELHFSMLMAKQVFVRVVDPHRVHLVLVCCVHYRDGQERVVTGSDMQSAHIVGSTVVKHLRNDFGFLSLADSFYLSQ